MKRFLLLSIALLALFSRSFAQHGGKEPCGHDDLMHELLKDPTFKKQYEDQQKAIQKEVLKMHSGQKALGPTPTYTIPIVIHVIHTGQNVGQIDNAYDLGCGLGKGGNPNPTEAQLRTSVDRVNQEFAASGTNVANKVRNTRAREAAIKLCLATRDPGGVFLPQGAVNRINGADPATWTAKGYPNAASLATRYKNYGVNTGTSKYQGVRSDTVIGLIQWTTSKYYNIYLVPELDDNSGGCGTQGNASFPSATTSSQNDRSLMIPSSFDGIRRGITTFVHEFGHAMSLNHTWNGTGSDQNGTNCPAAEGANCATQGDLICDIPPHKSMLNQQSPQCFPDGQANPCGIGVYGDFQDNYMNYTNCSETFFSQGQVDRMRAVFTAASNNNRKTQAAATNVTSCGCDGTNPPVADFVADKTTICSGDTVTFTDKSLYSPVYNSKRKWRFDITSGGGMTIVTDTGIVAKAVYAGPGPYTVRLTVTNPYGKDSLQKPLYINVTTPIGTDIIEGFEGATFPPAGWSITDASALQGEDVQWVQAPFGKAPTALKSANIPNNEIASGVGPNYLQTPVMDMTLKGSPQLTFDVAYRCPNLNAPADILKVLVSIDCGKTFTEVGYNKQGIGLRTVTGLAGEYSFFGGTYAPFEPTPSQWRNETVDLSSVGGKPGVIVRFERTGAGNDALDYLYIDNVNITDAPQPPTANFSYSNACAGDSTQFTDNSTSAPTSWDWTFQNGSPATSTLKNPKVLFPGPGTYNVTLTATNAQGSSAPKVTSVTVNPGITVIVTPRTYSMCQGDSVTFHASGGDTYQWSNGGTLDSIRVSPTINTTYVVTATNTSTGCTAKDSSIVRVNPLPTAPAGGDVQVCNGDSVRIGLPNQTELTYDWSPGTFLSDSTDGNPFTKPTSSISYILKVADINTGCKAEDTVLVTVNTPPSASVTPATATICYGSSVTINGAPVVAGNTYEWSSGDNTASITKSPELTTTYYFAVTDTNFCIGRDTSVVTVQGPKSSFTFVNQCFNTTSNADTVYFTGTTNPQDIRWHWSFGTGVPTDTSNLASPSFIYTIAGTYAVALTVYDTIIGCYHTLTDTINVAATGDPAFAANFNSSTNQTCTSIKVDFTDASTGNPYTWVYKFSATDSIEGYKNVSYTFSTPAVYTVTMTVTNGCESKSTTKNITIDKGPVKPTAGPDVAFCPGGAAVTIGGDTITGFNYAKNDYLWNPTTGVAVPTDSLTTANPAVTTTYVLTKDSIAYAPGACPVRDTVIVTVSNTPFAKITPSKTPATICRGDNITLTANSGSGYTYLWGESGGGASIPVGTATNVSVTVAPNVTKTYTVQVQPPGGCNPATATLVVTVNSLTPPVISFAGNPVICPGSTKQLSAPGGFLTYKWASNPVGFSASTPVVNISQPGTYSVTVSDNLGCTASGVTPPPPFTIDNISVVVSSNVPGDMFCSGDNLVLTANEGSPVTNYYWNTSEITKSITVNTGGTYIVTVTNNNNCRATASINALEDPAPIPSIRKNRSTFKICAGDTITMYPDVVGQSYAWYKMPSATPVSTDSAFKTSAIGTYYLIVQYSTCQRTSDPVVIEKLNRPSVAITSSIPPIPPPDITICEGDSVELTASSGNNVKFEWFPSTYFTAKNGKFSNTVTVGASDIYYVIGTAPNGCTDTAYQKLNASPSPKPTIISSKPFPAAGPLIICDNEVVTFEASVANNSYLWEPTLEIVRKITVTKTGKYYVKVSDANGCFGVSEKRDVEVRSVPNAKIYLPTQDTTICQGKSVTLASSNGSSWTWSNGQTTQNITVYSAGTYTVVITNNDGCSKQSLPRVINVTPRPVPLFKTPRYADDTTICQGSSITLEIFQQANAGAATYQWKRDGVDLPGATTRTLATSQPGTYTVRMSNECGDTLTKGVILRISPQPTATVVNSGPAVLCLGDSTILHVVNSNGTSFQWRRDGVIISGATDSILVVKAGGDYTVLVKNACNQAGKLSLPINIKVYQAATAQIVLFGNPMICPNQGGPTLVANMAPDYRWQWKRNGFNITGATTYEYIANVGGTYTVEITNSCNKPALSNAIVIEEFKKPKVVGTTPDKDLRFCEGGYVDLNITVVDSGNSMLKLYWVKDKTDTIDRNINTRTKRVTQTGVYTVLVYDKCGGAYGATEFAVVVDPKPNVTFSTPSNLSICRGESVTMSVSSDPITTYVWSNGSQQKEITVQRAGAYSVTVTNIYGCSRTSGYTVDVDSSVKADFTYTMYPNSDPPTILFLNQSVGGDHYVWTFGDKVSATDVNPEHTYAKQGEYEVTLYVFNTDGCTDSIVKRVESKKEDIMPNAFSPNDDGINDIFRPRFENVEVTRGQVFDRWGRLQYEWKGTLNGWNGKDHNGNDAPVATYFYILEGKIPTKNGNKASFVEKGYVTLFRN